MADEEASVEDGPTWLCRRAVRAQPAGPRPPRRHPRPARPAAKPPVGMLTSTQPRKGGREARELRANQTRNAGGLPNVAVPGKRFTTGHPIRFAGRRPHSLPATAQRGVSITHARTPPPPPPSPKYAVHML